MSVLIALFTLLGTTGMIMFMGTQDLGLDSGVKLMIVLPFVLLTVYALARIPPKKEKKTVAEAQSLLLRLFDRGARALSRQQEE